MKRILIWVAMIVFISGFAMARFGRCGANGGQGAFYDVTAETVLDATVVGPDANAPARTLIQLADGRQVSLFTAPIWYLQQQNIVLNAGMAITVTGVFTVFQDGSEGVMARQITTGGDIFVFRNEAGIPLWTARRGMNAAPGNVNRCGVLSTTLSTLPVQDLSDGEAAAILKMREEEKLARDVYLTLFQKWNLRIFNNIAQSEQSHMDAVETLLDRYGLDDPAADTTVGVFSSPQIMELYRQLVAQGETSLVEALVVGATIEDMDIADLQRDLDTVDNEDIRVVFQNLMKGSRNHLRAFSRMLDRYDGSYTPQYLSADAYNAIVTSAMERGVILDADGNVLSACGGRGTGRGRHGGGNW